MVPAVVDVYHLDKYKTPGDATLRSCEMLLSSILYYVGEYAKGTKLKSLLT